MNPFLWPRWAQGAAMLALALAAFLLWDWLDDRVAVREHDAQREAAAAGAREIAAIERADDAAINTTNEDDLHDAIDAAPTGGSLSPAQRALNCERLRKLGRIPAACRSTGGD